MNFPITGPWSLAPNNPKKHKNQLIYVIYLGLLCGTSPRAPAFFLLVEFYKGFYILDLPLHHILITWPSKAFQGRNQRK